MKKIIAALAIVTMMASSASALSFTWKATQIAFEGTKLKSDTAVSAYLVYLSSGSYASTYAVTPETTAASLAGNIGTSVASASKTSALSALSAEFSFDYGTYKNGDVFGMLLAYEKDGKTYLNLSSETYTLSGISSETSTIDAAQFAFSYSGPTESSTVKSGGGWTAAVPEPSTAMLALAGLALLIKRRRA